MSDIVSNAAPEVQQKAEGMGWIPPERFTGDPERFVDADEFVERGQTVLPILRKNNERLEHQVRELQGSQAALQAALAESREAIEAMKEFQIEETKRQVQEARSTLKEQLKLAKREGDTDLEVELADEIARLDAAENRQKAAPSTSKPTGVRAEAMADPEFTSWQSENPWFGVDNRRTALAVAIAQELRADPANNGLVGRAFYERASQEAAAALNITPRSASKVEGSKGGGGGGGSSPSGRTYKDLPAEARAQCDKQASKFVGPNSAFKTKAEWQAQYTKVYFAGEEE